MWPFGKIHKKILIKPIAINSIPLGVISAKRYFLKLDDPGLLYNIVSSGIEKDYTTV